MNPAARPQPHVIVSRYIVPTGYSQAHARRIKEELKAAGAMRYDLFLPESRCLPLIIHPDEHIRGVVYGRYRDGTGALIATDRRILFIDKKFLFTKYDEITYQVLSGITQSNVGLYGTVTIHTRIGDYSLRTLNQKSALNFVEYIETHFLEHNYEADPPFLDSP